MPVQRVLIAGCGYLGAALGERLAARGDVVFGLRRRAELLPGVIRPIAADLGSPASLRAAIPEAIDAVVYAAGADRYADAAYRGAYVEGPGNLLRVLAERGQKPRRLVFVSSTAVHPQERGEWVDETSPVAGRGFAAASLLAGEERVRGAGLPAAVLRLGGIYGPGRDRLVREVREGRARLRPGPPRYTNRIHRDDAAAALQHLLDLAEPAPLHLGVDCEPADRNDVLRWLARALGIAAPPFGEATLAAGGRPETNKRCRNARLLASGFVFRYPTYREGMGTLLA